MLLLVADGLMIVLELLLVGLAVSKVLYCNIGRGIELYIHCDELYVHCTELYVHCNDLTVCISQLNLS